jgi:hypothetical protein
MNKQTPKIIEEVGFDFHWNVEKVWALDIPVEEMEIRELVWHFDIPFWNTSGESYNLTPNQVLEDPEKYKNEFDRIMKADLLHPLDIMFWKNRWLLLDGLHRLAKARKLGLDRVKVRKVPRDKITLIEK